MTRTRIAALLWFVAAAASLAGGLMSEPIKSSGVVAGALFFVLGVVLLVRDRRASRPTP